MDWSLFIDCYALYWLSDHLSTILKAWATHTRKLNTKSISSKKFTYTKHALLLVFIPLQLFSVAKCHLMKNNNSNLASFVEGKLWMQEKYEVFRDLALLKEDLETLMLLLQTF